MVQPGTRVTIDLPVARLYTSTELSMPVEVVHGRQSGPRLFVSAAIHGDELNGVEIIRRVLAHSGLRRLRGSLIAIPVVNVHGLLNRSRYLPDRRDLNRSFPGSDRGSLTARVAGLFMAEIVSRCTHGIDLHTGAVHRENLPQIRANLDDAETRDLAKLFGVPVLLNADFRDGSLRAAAAEQGIPMLLYEAGEALRFSELAIRAGVRGVLNVMRALEMLPPSRRPQSRVEAVIARGSSWVRASQSGIMRTRIALGAHLREGDRIAAISSPLGADKVDVTSPFDGILIGRSHLPLVQEGEALFHIARFRHAGTVAERVDELHNELEPSDPYDQNP